VADAVEIFQAAVDALNRVDRGEMLALLDPQVTFLPLRSAVSGPYIGHKGMHDFLDENAARFEVFRAEFDELRPLDDGRLVAIGYIYMRGHGDADETRYRTAGIAAFRNGRMSSWHDYGNVDAALSAAAPASR
jgi:hypothetical protein